MPSLALEVAVDDLPVQHVHGRRADEARDEDVGRPVVELERRARLLDDAGVHDDDLVGHRHRLDLVVGDVDGRHLEALVQRLDLRAHLHAQLGVEIGERLVEQEHLRIAHDGAAHGDALPLAARELAGIAVQQLLEAEDLRRPQHLPVHHRGRRLGELQGERHVVEHGHVRVERIVLEHHGDVAVLRRQRIDHPLADGDLARGDVLEAGDHAQQRGLAAAGRPDQHHELAVGNVDADAVQHLDRAERLAHVADVNGRHSCSPFRRVRIARQPSVSVCAWRKDAPAPASIIPDRRNIKDKRRSWWQASSFRTLTGRSLP